MIGILGGGISALALGNNLKKDFQILEQNNHSGGLCSSLIKDGFTFDVGGPHIIFSKNEKILNYMKLMLGNNINQKYRNSKIYFDKKFIKYPFENGLSELSKENCFDCIYNYINNPYKKTPSNLEEWAYFTFGKGIAEKYFIPYNEKIWNTPANCMSLDFVSRIPKPPLEDVLKSAIGISTEGYKHQLNFYYPNTGGYHSLINTFVQPIKNKILYNEKIIEIEKINCKWKIKTKNNEFIYDKIISTIPIHEFVKIWKNCPIELKKLTNKLNYNGLINICIALKNDINIPYMTVYVPDSNIIFHRLTFPKNFSDTMVPKNCSSIMAEITTKNINDDIFNKCIQQLEENNFLQKNNILFTHIEKFKYGYPIYDLNYKETISNIKNLITNYNCHLLGRFGEFEYINSDMCIEKAINLSEKLNA